MSRPSVGCSLVTTSRGPGRPLDPTRDTTILDATLELFSEVGWDGLTVADIAKRAKVGLSTIYRRWDSKSRLVAAAIASTLSSTTEPAGAPVSPETILEAMRLNLTGQRAQYYPSLLAAMRSEPAVAEAIRTAVIDPDRDRLRSYVAGALPEGTSKELINIIADIGPAVLVHRAIVIGETLDPAITQELTKLIEETIGVYCH